MGGSDDAFISVQLKNKVIGGGSIKVIRKQRSCQKLAEPVINPRNHVNDHPKLFLPKNVNVGECVIGYKAANIEAHHSIIKRKVKIKNEKTITEPLSLLKKRGTKLMPNGGMQKTLIYEIDYHTHSQALLHLLTSNKLYESFPAHLPVHRRINVPVFQPYVEKTLRVHRKPPLDDQNPAFLKKMNAKWELDSNKSGLSMRQLRKLKTRDKHWVFSANNEKIGKGKRSS